MDEIKRLSAEIKIRQDILKVCQQNKCTKLEEIYHMLWINAPSQQKMTGLQKGTREVCFLYKSDDNQVNKNTLVINEDTTAQLKCVCLHLSVPAAELR